MSKITLPTVAISDSQKIEFISLELAREQLLRDCNSNQTMPRLIELAAHMFEDDWFKLLGELWDACDNVSEHFDELLYDSPLFSCEKPIFQMMTQQEIDFFESLPNTFEIYRGCYAENKWGLSWSLNKELAAGFPFLRRYQIANSQPLLVRATVEKSKVIAVKLDRGESEIITYRPKHVSTSHLRQP